MSTTASHDEWQLADLIPHRGSMQLLRRILAADEQSLWASARTDRPQSSCWGIEYLGQATAAFFTLAQHQQLADVAPDHAPAMGMLIGSRRYQAKVSQLVANQELLIEVSLQAPATAGLASSGLVKFFGRLWDLPQGALESVPLLESLSTIGGRLPYDTASLAALKGQLLAEGDLSVYIPPQPLPSN